MGIDPWLAVGSLAIALGACGFPKTVAATPPVTPSAVDAATATWPDASEAELNTGHDLFVARCNGCHGYPDLASVPPGGWPDVMRRMQKKANLDAKGTQAVQRFAMTARAQ